MKVQTEIESLLFVKTHFVAVSKELEKLKKNIADLQEFNEHYQIKASSQENKNTSLSSQISELKDEVILA